MLAAKSTSRPREASQPATHIVSYKTRPSFLINRRKISNADIKKVWLTLAYLIYCLFLRNSILFPRLKPPKSFLPPPPPRLKLFEFMAELIFFYLTCYFFSSFFSLIMSSRDLFNRDVWGCDIFGVWNLNFLLLFYRE